MALCFELYTSIIISSINSGPRAKRLERLDKLMEERVHENLLLGIPWVSESIGIVNEAWAVMTVLTASISLIFDDKLIPPRLARGAPT